MSTHQDILDLERTFWEADPAFHDAHYADDMLVIVGDQGGDRGDILADIADVPGLISLHMRDVEVRDLTEHVVALTYHATASREGQGEPYEARIGSVYVRRDGRWQLALHQHTPDNGHADA